MDLSLNNLLILKDDSKRCRKSTAIKLPKELNESMIPKYVVYYKECYNREKMLFREFFKIEKHPKVKNKRIYTSSKSNKICILDKLAQIKHILNNIENNIEIDEEEKKEENNIERIVLQKYVSIKKHETDSNKYYLIFDKKLGENRLTQRAICNKSNNFSDNLQVFIKKIQEKTNAISA